MADNREIHTGDTPSGQFLSASSFFPSKSFRQGAKNISPVAALLTVRTATIIQSNVTATEKIYLSLAQVSSEEAGNVAYCAQNFEESGWQLFSHLSCTRGEHPEWECESPPSHVEGEFTPRDTGRSKE